MTQHSNCQTEHGFYCPNCGRKVEPGACECSHCHMNLGMAAVKAEKAISAGLSYSQNAPKLPEVLIPRLGDILVEHKYITPKELDTAVSLQRQQSGKGNTALLGQILVAEGFIDQVTLDKVVTEQIFQLKSALETSNERLEKQVQERTAELELALKQLSRMNELKANFVSNVSHELRTPLAQIVGFVDLMKNDVLGPITDQQAEALMVMESASSRLWQLIEDLLQFSVASADQLSVKARPTSIYVPVQTAVVNAKPKATSRDIYLQARIRADLPSVKADEDKIQWVVDQLLDNAIKFTPPEGRVLVSTKPRGDQVTVSVMDTGIGIAPERMQELFQPFHQLDGSITRQHEGMGLSLALAQKIMQSHGSSIHVRSKVGVGSQFYFTLPIAKD